VLKVAKVAFQFDFTTLFGPFDFAFRRRLSGIGTAYATQLIE
jgi:hypothetical protein